LQSTHIGFTFAKNAPSYTMNHLVARIENEFLLNARYQLSAKEQKVILYLISLVNPILQSDFHVQVVKIKDLEKILRADAKKWGGLYKEMVTFQENIKKKSITFDSEVKINGKVLPGYVSWFQSITPFKDELGHTSLKFKFSEDLKPFLIDLNQYARINLLETLKMKSGFSIRLFQVMRAHRNKMASYQKVSELRYGLDGLKQLLGIVGKYDDFRNFKKKVLQVVEREINQYTSIEIKEIELMKTGRKVTGVKFIFVDNKKPVVNSFPSIPELSRAQIIAFNTLSDFGVTPAIAINKLLPKVVESEFLGFEDWYFEEALKIFNIKTNQKTKEAKAGTFVKWFLDDFRTDNFSLILENIQHRKKALQKENPEAWENRLKARDLSDEEFVQQLER